jgi:integrase
MKFEMDDIKNDEEIIDFLRAKNRRKSTEDVHLKRLRAYCNFIGKKPVELINEAVDDEENRIRIKKRRIRKYFIDYSEHLRNGGRSQYTIANHFSSIKTFYRNSEIELPSIPINSTSEVKRARSESIPSKEDIRIALGHTKFKYRAIILLMSSSGMGSGEVRNLTIGDFLKAIDEFLDYEDLDVVKIAAMLDKKENIIGSWNVHRQKQGNSYYTFSSPESIKSIVDYLVERQKRDGRIMRKDEPLFENFGKKIDEHSFAKNFMRINDDAGFGLSGRQRFFKSHSLRKYFASILHKNGLSSIDIDWFLGHEISGVNRSYIKSDPSKLKEEYLKVVEDLSIAKVKVTKVTTPEYDSLISRLGARDQEVETLKEQYKIDSQAKDEEIKKLKAEKDAEMEKMEAKINEIKKSTGEFEKIVKDFLPSEKIDFGETMESIKKLKSQKKI